MLSCFACIAQKCSLKISGHVHSTSAHVNLEKATIVLAETGETLVTNSNGDFTFNHLCAGHYTLHISHTSYAPVTRMIELKAHAHLDIDLLPIKNILDEVTIITSQRSKPTGTIQQLSGAALEQTRGLSLAEALNHLNGVTMLQSGSNVSKPVIHGLHSNRILTINNGVRQEGQQWGNEHAPEVDPFIATNLTVVKGVDELRYGSDAIGGVILVEPKPLRAVPGHSAEVNSMYFTNNREYLLSGTWEQQSKKTPALTYRLQGTYKRGGNVLTPDYRLNNTGIRENNFSGSLGYRSEHFSSELFYSYFNNKTGIFTGSHIGNLTDLKKAIEADRPVETFTGDKTYNIERPYQHVTHHLLKSKTTWQTGAQKFNLLVSAQLNRRKEYDIVRSGANKKPQMHLDIFTLTEDLSWEHAKWKNFNGTVGINATQQDNSYAGRYFIPNYTSYRYGGYAIEKWRKNKWEAAAGIRYDQLKIHTNRLLTSGTVFDKYDFKFSTLAASISAGHTLSSLWKLNTNISLASRAPHVNELLSNGIHHGTATYETGDITLRPERSFNIALNSLYHNSANSFILDVSLYRNDISNFIYQQPRPGQPVLTIAGAFPNLVYQQTHALLQGLDASASVIPFARFDWTMKYSMLRARNVDERDWLIGMPADRISNEFKFRFADNKQMKKTFFSIEVQHVFEQTRVPGNENAIVDYKEAPPAYTLVGANFYTSIKMANVPVTLYVGGNNLFNIRYRDYLNSMRYFTDEMGRNVSIRLQIKL